jgi:TRAP-type C4-dicarboxylate transport system permease small subunit
MSDPDEARDTPVPGWPTVLSKRLGQGLAGAVASLLAVLVALAALETGAWVLAELSWPQLAEIQGLLLVWLTFLTAAWGVEAGLHLGMELLVRRLPPGLRRWLDRLVAVLVFLFGALCAYHGARLTASVVNTLPATGWSAGWQYVPAVIGGTLIALLAALRLSPTDHGATAGAAR